MGANNRPRGRADRPGLNRDRVTAAAIQLVDREGPGALTMRRLAVELGVEAMSLYNHVPTKNALIDSMAGAILARVDTSVAKHGDGLSWEDRARALAHSFRRATLAHPHTFTVVLTRPVDVVVALRPVQDCLAILADAGLDTRTSVHAMRTFLAFLTGALLRELGSALSLNRDDPARVEQRLDALRAPGSPKLDTAYPYLLVCDHEAEFDFGLNLLISAVSRLPKSGSAR